MRTKLWKARAGSLAGSARARLRKKLEERRLRPPPVPKRVPGIGTDAFPLGRSVHVKKEKDRVAGFPRIGTIVGHVKTVGVYNELRTPVLLTVKFTSIDGSETKDLPPRDLEVIETPGRLVRKPATKRKPAATKRKVATKRKTTPSARKR
jgi:hypothetical protein